MLQDWFGDIFSTLVLFILSLPALGYLVQRMLQQLNRQGTNWGAVLAVISIGLMLRLAWTAWLEPQPFSDFAVYWDYANRFVRGDFAYPEITIHPGIILLYTLIFKIFDPSLYSAWTLNLIFAGLMMLAGYGVARQLFDRSTALVVLGITALLPQLVTYNALLASEVPAVTYGLVFLWAVLNSRTPDNTNRTYWLACGLVLYGAVLIRSTNLLWLAVFALLILLMRRDQWRAQLKGFAITVLTCGVLLSTWVAHQTAVAGKPKLFWGMELWLASVVQYNPDQAVTDTVRLNFAHKLNTPAINQGGVAGKVALLEAMQRESLAIIRKDPVKYLQFGWVRLRKMLQTHQTGILWSVQGSVNKPIPDKVVRRMAVISTVLWQILLSLSVIGVLLFRPGENAGRREGGLAVALFVAPWLVFHYLVSVHSERYGFQLIPFAVLLGSYGLYQVATMAKDLLLSLKPPAGNVPKQTAPLH